MNENYIKGSRNTHKDISKLPSKILESMMINNNSIFKLLTFKDVTIIDNENESDQLSSPYKDTEMNIVGNNLTYDEKVALVFKSYDDANDYRIQLQPNTDDALLESQCRLHIYISNVTPLNQVLSMVTINFDVVCHNKFNMINGGTCTRIDCICEELINFIDGLELENTSSEIFFNYPRSRNKDAILQNISNLKNYFGNTLTMSVLYGAVEDKSYR